MTETIAPRLLWNENLSKEFFKSRNIESSCDPVCQQLESVVINRNALFPFSYNGSIVEHRGRILLAYRFHHQGSPSSELAIAELDDKFNVKNNKKVQLVPNPVASEDPRFHIFKDELYLSYIDSRYPVQLNSVVKYGLLAEDSVWRLVDTKQPAIGKNDGSSTEKNFVFFEENNQLFCLYQSSPDQIIYEMEGSTAVAEHISPGPHWPYGPIRGGYIIPYQGKLLRFFHSRLDTYPKPVWWKYFCGCLLMEPEPPFNVISVSTDFIAQGCEICNLPQVERNKSSHYKQRIVFPGGCMVKGGDIWLSVGVNDSGICLLKITDLKL